MLDIKVTHQGLIIILLPLLCELAALGTILYLLDQTDKVMKKEAVSKAIVQEASALTKSIYESGDAIAGYSWTKDTKSLSKYRSKVDEIKGRYVKLENLSKGNIEREDRVYKLKRLSDSMVTLFVSQGMPKELGGNPNRNTDVKAFRDEAAKIYRPLLGAIETIIIKEKTLMRKHIKELLKIRESLKIAVTSAIVLSIIISITLVAYFSRRVGLRLGIVHRNIDKFLKQEPLLEPIKGKDEIADLDKAFHQLTQDLESLEKRKQEFVSMISHDIRSPLFAIQGTLAVVGQGKFGSLDKDGIARLDKANNNIEKLNRMINDLLTIDKIDSGKFNLEMEETELKSMAEDSIDSVRALAEKKHIAISNECDEVELDCDPTRIDQVLVNLLSNAIKFSPEQSRIRVYGSPASSMGSSSNETVRVMVEDNGRGIPEEKLASIFERFSQVDRSDSTDDIGFGLGLPICKAIVAAHGGTIGVNSKPEGTTTFWFELPRYHEN